MERTYVKIDLDAVRNNAELAKKKARGAGVMAVIKADAYGHGSIEVARALEDMAWGFGAAIPEEGIQLRRNGISKPILLLGNVVPYRVDDVIDYGLTPSISNIEAAETFSRAAAKKGKIVEIHIGVDTGMGRIGFLESEKEILAALKDLPNLKIAGLCTHFARADETDKLYSERQRAKFLSMESFLRANGAETGLKHIGNSAGIIEFDEHYDIVRPGIMLYGLYPSKEVRQDFGLIPAMSWYARISHVKSLPEGCGISYGSTYVTKKTTKIATVPVGYADGYPRALSNIGRVIVNGRFAPVVGRVCMDQFMVDVTDIPNVAAGTEAVLVGSSGGAAVTVEELADAACSFNYEFVCGIGLRVPRYYYKDGGFYKRVDYLEIIDIK
ncbi:MAG: alanine racemase [Clostridiales bacterium]|nr:alanine racemase [Clostridiales bacterium]